MRERVRRTVIDLCGRVPGATALARLTLETIRVCLRYRVTGLASEAGFFALLSLPPLILGLFGGLGYIGQWMGADSVATVTAGIQSWAERFLTDATIADVLLPTIDDVLRTGRADLISLGFVLSLWSGSRALNVFVDTISIMYGQSGERGIVRTRTLSFSLYTAALLMGVVIAPLLLIGPTWLGQILPPDLDVVSWLYWPVVVVLVLASLTTLFQIATPRRGPWWRDVPGALLTLVIWVLASFVVRGSVAGSLGGSSIYGPLSAPIVLLIWLYALAIAVLIGAALNAASRRLWPTEDLPSVRASVVDWARQGGPAAPGVRMLQRRRQRPLTPMPEGVLDEPEEGPMPVGSDT
ncbi:MAG: YihY/virulence factor BrkB family protein [Micrococcales bacterium]|nr:YihY/virulence factor BrkB family protein [Micrococcales bacterium]